MYMYLEKGWKVKFRDLSSCTCRWRCTLLSICGPVAESHCYLVHKPELLNEKLWIIFMCLQDPGSVIGCSQGISRKPIRVDFMQLNGILEKIDSTVPWNIPA